MHLPVKRGLPVSIAEAEKIGLIIDMMEGHSIPEDVFSILKDLKSVVALTGAGISVESGIPDFRSPGGLWDTFDPAVYASIQTFLSDPRRSWKLFRAVDEILRGKRPNPAHYALADLEQAGILEAVITQNIDGLHQEAGTDRVIEVHGNHRFLECLRCGLRVPVDDPPIEPGRVPRCEECGFPLKPSVVLFGEAVRHVDEANEAVLSCEALFVIGTSAQVYPVASLPASVKEKGGLVFEFNLNETCLTGMVTDCLFRGRAGRSLPFIRDFMISGQRHSSEQE